MGRRAQGHRIRWRNGWAYVRFTHEGRDCLVALGTKDASEAASAAAREHARIVSGRKGLTGPRVRASTPLDVLLGKWMSAREGELDELTVRNLASDARRYLAFFGTLNRMASTEACEQYARERLRRVLRVSVRRELSYIRNFFAWCVDQNLLSEAPLVKPVPRKAQGVRSGHQRLKPVEVTQEEAHAIVALLPEWSRVYDGERWPCRARFVVAWETGLRPSTISTLSVPQHYARGEAELRIEAKHDKARFSRSVPLSEAARAALDSIVPEEGLIFSARRYRHPLKRAAVAVLGKRRGEDFAQYDFRHGRVTHLLDSGAPLTGTAFLVGHKQISTTNRYTHPSERAARFAIDLVDGQFQDNAPSRVEQHTVKKPLVTASAQSGRCDGHEGNAANSRGSKGQKGPKGAYGRLIAGLCPDIPPAWMVPQVLVARAALGARS